GRSCRGGDDRGADPCRGWPVDEPGGDALSHLAVGLRDQAAERGHRRDGAHRSSPALAGYLLRRQ
nr:hypothetical protein [Tanacetum cinerariifolium]